MTWNEKDNKLEKTFELKDFISAVTFVDSIATRAEAMDHHPDIKIHDYKKVTIELTTHSEGKITKKDHELAKKIDEAYDEVQDMQ